MTLDLSKKLQPDGPSAPQDFSDEALLRRAKRAWLWIGVTLWGIPMFVIQIGRDVYRYPEYFLHTESGLLKTAFGFLLYLAGGYFFGYWMWHWLCRRKVISSKKP